MIDEEMAKSIVMTFLTISTSVIGFFIGYQTNKPTQAKIEEDEKTALGTEKHWHIYEIIAKKGIK